MEDFTQIFYTYKDRVYNQVFRMLGSPQDAEEAVQDVFLRVYKGLSEFRGDAKISSWIFRIATNVCISKWKQRKGDSSSIEDEVIQSQVMKQHYTPAPDVQFEKEENRKKILESIAKLSPEYSSVVTLYYFEEMSYEEIAQITDIPMGTVGTYLHRAKNDLKNILRRELA